ncbi:MAG: glucose-1-phosphate cytidylyltransferase [archaeon]
MKVVILAGGFGSRLSEETIVKPKPLVEIGDKPILWHIMKIYSHYGFNDFIICLGYKGHMIKEWFANYFIYNSDLTIDLKTNKMEVHENNNEDWKVTLVDTGLYTQTGGRIKRIQKYIGNQRFMMTYGDGVANVDIKALIKYHESQGKIATLTATIPEGRFGALQISKEGVVNYFGEKKDNLSNWVNGGFFVLEPKIFDYIKDDSSVFEKDVLEKLVEERQLVAYKHSGFWKPMDKLSDKLKLEELWNSGNAPWKIWQ